jgi:hypothetical protein
VTSFVPFTYVVIRGLPFQRTTESVTNPEPVTVRVNASPPAFTWTGETEVNAGIPLSIGRLSDEDVPPPGAGLKTATRAAPADVISPVPNDTVKVVALTKVVVRVEELNVATELGTNPVPVSVRVKAGPPAVSSDGESDFKTGTGFSFTIAKVSAVDEPPPGRGLKTVTDALPAEAMSAPSIRATRCVLPWNVVVRGLPFQHTTEPCTKFAP